MEDDGRRRGRGARMVQEAFPRTTCDTLGRRTTIANQETKQLALLNGTGVPVEKRYIVNGQSLHLPGTATAPARQSRTRQVFYRFRNDEKSGLGAPMLAGVVRVYQADSKGGLPPEGVRPISGEASLSGPGRPLSTWPGKLFNKTHVPPWLHLPDQSGSAVSLSQGLLTAVEKHHSCINTRAIIEYFQAQLPEAVPIYSTGLGPEIAALADPREFLLETNNWVSSEVVIQMFRNARRITGQKDIAFEIGFQSVARKKLGYVQRIIMFAYKNPRSTLKRAQAINDKFNKNKRIEIVSTSRDRAVIRLHWFAHIPGHLDFCRFNQGIYSSIPTIWNLPPAQVVESRCFFQGDDCCEYHLKWDKKSSPNPGCAFWGLVVAPVHHHRTGAGQRAAET